MPYTEKQIRTAQAVEHGFKPSGSASGFTKAFADYMLKESGGNATRKPIRKKKGKR